MTVKPRGSESTREARARIIQRLHELGLGTPLEQPQARQNPGAA